MAKLKRLVLLLCFTIATGLAGEAHGGYPLQKGKYAGIVQQHADVLLKHARDTYGPVHSPLFVDAISPHTLEPYVWTIDPDERVVQEFGQPAKQILANFLFMQGILDMLRELTKISGEERYETAARECAAFALKHCTAPTGLIHWGKHATYETLSDRPLGHPGTPGYHYFTGGTFASWKFLYEITPEAVNRHIEQQWNTTINSREKWRRLEWGLHPQYNTPYGNPWDHIGDIAVDVTVPFLTQKPMYPQIAFELLYAARMYADHPGNDPRSWDIGRILMKRLEDSRHPVTGLWPVMYVYGERSGAAKRWFGSSVRDELGIPFFARLAEITRNQHDGQRFLDFTLKDLRAYRKYKQVYGTNQYYTSVTLEGEHTGATDDIADSVLWTFALVYRMTGERFLWDAVRDIAKERGYGDIGEPDGSNVALNFDSDIDVGIDPAGRDNITAGFIVHTFVELYRRTEQEHGRTAAQPYLEIAARVADTIIDRTYVNGVFARSTNARWARTACMTPMALLNLEAAMQGIELNPESVFCRRWVYRFTRNRDRLDDDNYHDWGIYTGTVDDERE